MYRPFFIGQKYSQWENWSDFVSWHFPFDMSLFDNADPFNDNFDHSTTMFFQL